MLDIFDILLIITFICGIILTIYYLNLYEKEKEIAILIIGILLIIISSFFMLKKLFPNKLKLRT